MINCQFRQINVSILAKYQCVYMYIAILFSVEKSFDTQAVLLMLLGYRVCRIIATCGELLRQCGAFEQQLSNK